MRIRTLGLWQMVILAAACTPEATVGSRSKAASAADGGALAAVFPASKYAVTYLKNEGRFNDVNGRNLIVGTLGGRAAAMQLGTNAPTTLFIGRNVASTAEAVNNQGSIVGGVTLAGTSPVEVPAYWSGTGAAPVLFSKKPGRANDISDQGLAVGTFTTALGYGEAFAWNPRTGALDLLPGLPNMVLGTEAYAINNDHIILGRSDAETVVWQFNGSVWGVGKARFINGHDIDAGYGVVGETGLSASYGTPDFAGHFATVGRSVANAVTPRGIVAGVDDGVFPAGVGYFFGGGTAFAADRAGVTTYLPYPSGTWISSFGLGINECGVVVGEIWKGGSVLLAYPVVWNPGC